MSEYIVLGCDGSSKRFCQPADRGPAARVLEYRSRPDRSASAILIANDHRELHVIAADAPATGAERHRDESETSLRRGRHAAAVAVRDVEDEIVLLT